MGSGEPPAPLPFDTMSDFPRFLSFSKEDFDRLRDSARSVSRRKTVTERVLDKAHGQFLMHASPFGRALRRPGDKVRFGPMRGTVVSSKLVRSGDVAAPCVNTIVELSVRRLTRLPLDLYSKRRSPYAGETVLVVFKDESTDAGTEEDGSYVGLGEYVSYAGQTDGEHQCWVRTSPADPLCLFPCACVYDERFLVWLPAASK